MSNVPRLCKQCEKEIQRVESYFCNPSCEAEYFKLWDHKKKLEEIRNGDFRIIQQLVRNIPKNTP